MIKAKKRVVVHPGVILQILLDENKITQTKLAKYLCMPQTKISEICRGKRGISALMAKKLSIVLGIAPDVWMRIQNSWELSQVNESKLKKLKSLVTLDEDLLDKKAA